MENFLVKYIALGDSFTEGVGDEDERYPNGVRGWADRVAEAWSMHEPDLEYANLSIRGRLLRPILAEQLEPCLALKPDIVSINAGGNDLLRRSVDINGLVHDYEEAIKHLRENGSEVLIWTLIDPMVVSSAYTMVRGRVGIFNELIREKIIDRYNCTAIDMWRMREYADERYWSWDRLHMSPAGHQHMAIEVLNSLGVKHNLENPDLGPELEHSRTEVVYGDIEWVRTFAVPWIGRRIRGTSSGDEITEKYSTYIKAADMPQGVRAISS